MDIAKKVGQARARYRHTHMPRDEEYRTHLSVIAHLLGGYAWGEEAAPRPRESRHFLPLSPSQHTQHYAQRLAHEVRLSGDGLSLMCTVGDTASGIAVRVRVGVRGAVAVVSTDAQSVCSQFADSVGCDMALVGIQAFGSP